MDCLAGPSPPPRLGSQELPKPESPLPRESKYPIFSVFDPKSHLGYGVWDQSPGTWTLWVGILKRRPYEAQKRLVTARCNVMLKDELEGECEHGFDVAFDLCIRFGLEGMYIPSRALGFLGPCWWLRNFSLEFTTFPGMAMSSFCHQYDLPAPHCSQRHESFPAPFLHRPLT